MIIEVVVSRGLGIYIDGKEAAKPHWSVGETRHGYTCHEELNSDRGVPIGEHRVTGLEFDVPLEEFHEGADPTTLTLKTEEGSYTAKVTQVQTGGYDEEGEELTITLEGGQQRDLDETKTYIRAEC